MCIVTLNMSSGEVEYADSITYSDEVLCTGWNPALEIRPYTESHNTIPRDLLATDVDAFLTKMYAFQQQ